MKSKKKKVLGVIYSRLQTYTRYSGVADEEQNKIVVGVMYGSLWVILLKRAMAFLISLKGPLVKTFGKPWLRACFFLKDFFL